MTKRPNNSNAHGDEWESATAIASADYVKDIQRSKIDDEERNGDFDESPPTRLAPPAYHEEIEEALAKGSLPPGALVKPDEPAPAPEPEPAPVPAPVPRRKPVARASLRSLDTPKLATGSAAKLPRAPTPLPLAAPERDSSESITPLPRVSEAAPVVSRRLWWLVALLAVLAAAAAIAALRLQDLL